MKITFFSNYLNHHQLPFCLEMAERLGEDFKFVVTTKISEKRLKLGYKDMDNDYPFVVKAYDDGKKALEIGNESDVVIIGSAPTMYIKERLKEGKLTFRYSERIFKKGFNVKSFLSVLLKRAIFERRNIYLLCSSAYSANDYNMAGAYRNRCFKWGYFPEVKEYENIDKILKEKKQNRILWAGRFLDWKHPDLVIEVARKLKENNYDFEINMIGIGEMYDSVSKMIKQYNLQDNVKLLGSMSPGEVRKNMEDSLIYLFTSDRGEGWGAVLNESMNSGCAVVASHEIGSVPFLITNNKNGLIYKDGDSDDLFNKVKYLLDNNDVCKKLGKNAYLTMANLWNARIAAERIISLSEQLLNGQTLTVYEDGPCSIAKELKDNWYMD